MTKYLEALQNIKREAGIPYYSALYDIDMWREDFTTVENALKALEIIKEKNVNVGLIMRVTLVSYNTIFVTQNCKRLTKKEYCLLMKVLL